MVHYITKLLELSPYDDLLALKLHVESNSPEIEGQNFFMLQHEKLRIEVLHLITFLEHVLFILCYKFPHNHFHS